MGAWGHLPFENDDALDFGYEIEDATDVSPLSEAFEDVLTEDGVDESHLGSNAVAAAALVASALGAPEAVSGRIPEDLKDWLELFGSQVSPPLAALGARALTAVLGQGSELAELWDESEDPAWREHTAALQLWLATS